MVDTVSKKKRSSVMRAVKSRNNKSTELAVISLFKARKITGWRRHYKIFGKPIIGKPDFVFPKSKIAVFIDGCFWHGCEKHLRLPKSNQKYWNDKISGNIRRDKAVSSELKKRGWTPIRIWEHELTNRSPIKKLLSQLKG